MENIVILIFLEKQKINKKKQHDEKFKKKSLKYIRRQCVCERNWRFDFPNRLARNARMVEKNTNFDSMFIYRTFVIND